MFRIISIVNFFSYCSMGKKSNGGVLVSTIVAMVIMGLLGAGMVSMLSSSTFHEVRANHGQRAFYLAESGFRYASVAMLTLFPANH